VAGTAGDSISDTLMISTAGLSSGFHNFFLRAEDSNHVFSLYEGGSFYLYDTLDHQLDSVPLYSAEYFYDMDPGIGNGILVASFSSADSILVTDTLPTAPLTSGTHNLFLRVRDSLHLWSLYEGQSFVICNFIPVPDFTTDTVCQNSPTTFTDLTTNLDTTANYTYSWDFNSDGITDDTTEGNTTHIFTTGGTHTVTLIVNNTSGCIDTVMKTVYVDSLPVVTLALPLDTMCKLDTLVLSGGNPPGGIYSGPGVYNGIFYSDSTTTGNKTIIYTYTNADSCTATATDVIHVNPCTGINELSAANFKFIISPNPFTSSAMLEIISAYADQKLRMEIFDVYGKSIRTAEIQNINSQISREGLSPGIYFLKLSGQDKILGTAKLVITD
jgi:PKD repeat protein